MASFNSSITVTTFSLMILVGNWEEIKEKAPKDFAAEQL